MDFQNNIIIIAAIATIAGVIIAFFQFAKTGTGEQVAKTLGITFVIVLIIVVIARIIPPQLTLTPTPSSNVSTISVPGAVVSDGSWKYSPTGPAGWQNTDFDDSTWKPAVSPSTGACGLHDFPSLNQTIAHNGGHDIWGDDVGDHSFGYFRKSFTLTSFSSTANEAILMGGIDDDGDIYINGTRVVSDRNGTAEPIKPMNVAQYLVQGKNTISVYGLDVLGVCQYFELALILR